MATKIIGVQSKQESGAGDDIAISAGSASTSGAGGSVIIQAGQQVTTGGNGSVVIRAPGGTAGTNELKIIASGTNYDLSGGGATGVKIRIIARDRTYVFEDGTGSGFILPTDMTTSSRIRMSNTATINWSFAGATNSNGDAGFGYATRGVVKVTDGQSNFGSLSYGNGTTAVSTNQDNIVLSGSAFQRINCTSASNLTGIAPTTSGVHVDGRVIWLHNVGSANLTLKHSVTSTAANQFITPTGGDVILGPNRIVQATYDTTSTKWRVHGETYPYVYPTTDGSVNQVLTTNGSGTLSWATVSSGGAGTVTSVDLSLPSIFSVSGSPVQSSGTLTGTLANQSVNLVFAGPSTGAATTPSFRSLVASDLPTITSLGTVTSGTWNATTIGLAYGGTGATTQAGAANAVLPTQTGNSGKYLITNGSDASWSTVATSNGTVTSVGLSLPSIFSVTNSPVQSSGTLTGALANQSANLVFAGPSTGVATAPSFRSLVATDLPTITSLGTVTSGTWNATAIGIAYGGTGQTTAAAAFNALSPVTTLGDMIYASGTNANARLAGNTTSTKQFLSQTGTGTVSAAPSWSTVSKSDIGLGSVENTALSTWAGSANITTLGTVATGTWSATTIGTSKGGTGLTSIGTANQILGANSGATGLEYKTITAGSNISVTHAANSVTIAASAVVTSVGLSLPAIFSVTNSPVQSSGTLTGTLANQSANLVFAGPSTGAATTPSFRSLVATDLPTITSLGTVTSGTWNATAIGIAYGGTGQSTAAAAYNALTPITSLGDLVYGSGTNAATRLAGNTTTTKNFLSQTGTGTASAAPSWSTVSKSDVGLGNVENTALSTWAGSANITTLGTVSTGTWSATNIALNKGGTAASLTAVNGGVVYSSASAMAITAAGTSNQVLISNGAAAPTWATVNTLPVVSVSDTAPSGISAGSLWWESSTGTLKVYYNDGTSSQWVDTSPASSSIGGTLSGVQIQGYSETKTSPAISAGALTLNIANGNTFTVSLNANITSLSITNVPTGTNAVSFTLILTADGSARTITWPASVKWPGGVAPTLTSTLNKIDVYTFLSVDNGTTWLGMQSGKNF